MLVKEMVKKDAEVVVDEQTRLGLELIRLRRIAFERVPKWFRDIKLKSIKSKMLRGEVRVSSYTFLSLSEVKQTHYSEIPLKGVVYHQIIKRILKKHVL